MLHICNAEGVQSNCNAIYKSTSPMTVFVKQQMIEMNITVERAADKGEAMVILERIINTVLLCVLLFSTIPLPDITFS